MSEQLQWDQISGRKVAVPRHVVHRSFASETVLLNVQTGHYHGMDAIGGRFFETLVGAGTIADAVTALAAEYDQPVERIQEDMTRFCAELSGLGLVELDG
jgi:hypothetical protein